ncbi:hypothetical protein PILCRDRAFT_818452 [Piloderma croceum F 1598]|uniref:Uncharacterized protein n=1 Tax=Piloderma croceum (strain F 1598) TaxID=765440 RepID=A0A0C3FX60_PILCF|nr:hypothetical protein PILCRDRAFT_818452 [Piloderma croceum F 1598]
MASHDAARLSTRVSVTGDNSLPSHTRIFERILFWIQWLQAFSKRISQSRPLLVLSSPLSASTVTGAGTQLTCT